MAHHVLLASEDVVLAALAVGVGVLLDRIHLALRNCQRLLVDRLSFLVDEQMPVDLAGVDALEPGSSEWLILEVRGFEGRSFEARLALP